MEGGELQVVKCVAAIVKIMLAVVRTLLLYDHVCSAQTRKVQWSPDIS
jgi:hypothetical protein